MSKIRLFLNHPKIIINQTFKINGKDFLYLVKVMRQKNNSIILVFNAIDGEFEANIIDIRKKDLEIKIIKKIREIEILPKITLAFAPVKNVRIDFVASKACEMGVTNFSPIITKRTIVKKINQERFMANIKEAIEQCNRNDMATLQQIASLSNFLANCHQDQLIILCDETISKPKIKEILQENKNYNEIILLIGPEGGFAPEELQMMRKINNLHPVTLGPTILRADTAIIAALALIKDASGQTPIFS